MMTYEYQVLRYLPDRVSGEFVNVGVVLFEPETHFLKAEFARSVGRVSNFFPGIDGRDLSRRLRHLDVMIEHHSHRIKSTLRTKLESPESILSVTRTFLTPDDTSLFFSEVKRGIDDDLEQTLIDLYERLVDNFASPISEEVRTDYDVWKKYYKPFFEKLNITSRLQSHRVMTQKDVLEFPYAWKNEVWHCYEPVTFDLKKSDSIKNKVYKWVGRLDELSTATEPISLQLLAALPNGDPELMAFILDKLDNKVFGSTKVSVIQQQEAEKFSKKVQEDIIEHETK